MRLSILWFRLKITLGQSHKIDSRVQSRPLNVYALRFVEYFSLFQPQASECIFSPRKTHRSPKKANKLELIVERHLITQRSLDTCLFTCVPNCFISNIRALFLLSNITSFTSHQRFTCCGNYYFWWMINNAMWEEREAFTTPKYLIVDNVNFFEWIPLQSVLLHSSPKVSIPDTRSRFRLKLEPLSFIVRNRWLQLHSTAVCNSNVCWSAERALNRYHDWFILMAFLRCAHVLLLANFYDWFFVCSF